MTQAENILASSFDISDIDEKLETVLHKVVVVSDIDGNDRCGFMVDSKNCEEYQEASRQVRIDGLKRSAKRKAALDTTTDEGAGVVAKMIEANEMTLACAVVKGWFGFENKGVAVPFSKPMLAKMFAKYPTWKDKVTAALENEANFLKS